MYQCNKIVSYEVLHTLRITVFMFYCKNKDVHTRKYKYMIVYLEYKPTINWCQLQNK